MRIQQSIRTFFFIALNAGIASVLHIFLIWNYVTGKQGDIMHLEFKCLKETNGNYLDETGYGLLLLRIPFTRIFDSSSHIELT